MLNTLLSTTAKKFPDNVAVVFGKTSYTYRELEDLSNQLAASFTELGIEKGDRVALFLFNRPEMLLCYYACFKIGATAVPIGFRLKAPALQYRINHSTPKILISETELFSEINQIISEIPSIQNHYLVDWKPQRLGETQAFKILLGDNKKTARFPEIEEDTSAVILYTSGTTGTPKGTVLTHGQLRAHTSEHAKLVGYQTDDRTLVCLGLSSNFAFSHQTLAATYAGATLDILPYFEVNQVLDAIRSHDITMLYMMPIMYNELINLAATHAPPIANKLRLAIVAGDTTPLAVFKQFRKIFRLTLCEGLGMTETQIYALNPLDEGKKIGSAGLAVPYMDVEVQNDQGIALPVREIGEIAVKGEIVTQGYLDNPTANAEAFRNGWFLTGDLGCFDDDGYLWFKGRKKQLIVHAGSNISPQEIEEAFYHHPAVVEVGVIGIPDPKEGEVIKAYIALKPEFRSVTEKELISFARRHLADYKIPKSIEFLDTLPKSTADKIDRRKLREAAAH